MSDEPEPHLPIMRLEAHDPLVCALDAYTGCDKCLADMAEYRESRGKAGEDGYLKKQNERQWKNSPRSKV